MSIDQLQKDLVAQLEAVKPVPRPAIIVVVWSLLCFPSIIFTMTMVDDFRASWTEQLISSPRFLLEFLFGVISAPIAAFAASYIGTPQEPKKLQKAAIIGVGIFILFLSMTLWSVFNPALPPSSQGARPHCVYETFLYSLWPLGLMIFALRHHRSYFPKSSAALYGIAATMPTSSMMHIACKYEPLHILGFHILPVLVMSFVLIGIHRKVIKML